MFDYLPDWISGVVHGWGENTLSCVGREVLLKANVHAVPTYPMSCFKLTTKVCDRMKTYISNYWWGSSIDSHKLHWQQWSKLTLPKGQGGMRFWDLQLFNKAMLGKQGWRMISRPESLCAQVLKDKYYPHGEFMSATRKRNSSDTRKAIVHGRDALKRGLMKRIAPGTSINVWEDNWIQGGLRPRVRLEDAQMNRVSKLFSRGLMFGISHWLMKPL